MSELTFDALDENGRPRLLAGVHRPPPFTPAGYVSCSCGTILQTAQAMNDHWQSGHFDRPLYHTDPRALDQEKRP